MTYKFIRVTSYYPQYLKSYYAKHSDMDSRSYLEQYKAITNDAFELASSFSKCFNKMEGVEAFDIISNATILQDTWKKENKLPADISNQELILQQLKSYQPTVVWIDDFSIVDEAWKKKLHLEIPSIKLLVGHICAPYNSVIKNKFRLFDIMFTCIPCFKKEIENLGIKTFLLYHSFDPAVLDKISVNNKFKETEFVFSGSLYTGSGFHKSRIEYIERMLQSGIKIDLFCNLESYSTVLKKKLMYYLLNSFKKSGLGGLIDKIPVLKKNKSYGDIAINYYSNALVKSANPPVFGSEMLQLLAKSKICFNIHGEVAEKCAGNIRLFEATGVGTCLVTDWKDNITDLFEPGKEIVTYKTVEECIEKVKWLVEHPEERKKIAIAGQQRTLKDHTVGVRAKALDRIFREELSKINSK